MCFKQNHRSFFVVLNIKTMVYFKRFIIPIIFVFIIFTVFNIAINTIKMLFSVLRTKILQINTSATGRWNTVLDVISKRILYDICLKYRIKLLEKKNICSKT